MLSLKHVEIMSSYYFSHNPQPSPPTYERRTRSTHRLALHVSCIMYAAHCIAIQNRVFALYSRTLNLDDVVLEY